MATIEEQLSNLIQEFINSFIAETSPEPAYLKHYAQLYSILPLCEGWTSFIGIRPDFVILEICHDDDNVTPVVVTDERMRNAALFIGEKKFAGLSCLIPDRPDSAIDCPHCQGTGQINIEGHPPGTIICQCGGLGWLADEKK